MICALQINPIETLHYESDTSILIAEALQRRGCKIFYYTPHHLFLENSEVKAKGRYITLNYKEDNFFTYESEVTTVSLNSCNLVLLRQDPPFDMNYITNTYLLELLDKKVLVINNPTRIRNWPEKLSIFKFPGLFPPSIVSCDSSEIQNFYNHHKDILFKPLYGSGGNGVCKIESPQHFDSTLKEYLKKFHYIMAQKFFPQIQHGDKRVLLIDGEILGYIKRIPASNSYLANLVAGATAVATELTAKEKEITHQVGRRLKADDIFFAGVDLINQHLIEINVTSPTACKAYNKIYNTHCEDFIAEKILGIIKTRFSNFPT
jgi:glutathione synthase